MQQPPHTSGPVAVICTLLVSLPGVATMVAFYLADTGVFYPRPAYHQLFGQCREA